jgi:hypothetical protein
MVEDGSPDGRANAAEALTLATWLGAAQEQSQALLANAAR